MWPESCGTPVYSFNPAQLEHVRQARQVLRDLEFDDERCNERSGLVLLALADTAPDKPWADAGRPMMGVTAIMSWIAEHFDVHWQPNTRETVRRRTLHQFVLAGLCVENPDEPARPKNSPKWCYQLTPKAGELLRSIDLPQYHTVLRQYLEALPGLLTMYERARDMERIPVTLPSGVEVSLSAGGQNILIRRIVEEFCYRFTPGGRVLYIGDADSKTEGLCDSDAIAGLGVELAERGKMPDLIVYMPDRNWLVLIEAAASHGPVDAKRYLELEEIFGGASAGIVYVTCFPSRAEMRRYLVEIAWETEVWCADQPDHLIHFNGERFLGPY